MIVAAQLRVIGRFLPASAPVQFVWAAELATMLLVVTVFVGFGIVSLRGENIVITVLRNATIDRASLLTGRLYMLSIKLCSLVVVWVLLYSTYHSARNAWTDTLFYTVPYVRRGHLYTLLFGASVCAGARLFADIIAITRGDPQGGLED
jgi:TRAP-type C4-dicarboxylate transport system permease small subunit